MADRFAAFMADATECQPVPATGWHSVKSNRQESPASPPDESPSAEFPPAGDESSGDVSTEEDPAVGSLEGAVHVLGRPLLPRWGRSPSCSPTVSELRITG